jgi:YD repeat-containing protein
MPVSINFWSSTAIVVTIPAGATSGPLVVSVAPSMFDSNYEIFTVTSQPLPNGWLDQDIGDTVLTGSATFAGGTFTVNAAGYGMLGTADGLHFVYQPLSGDGSIIARVASVQSNAAAGVMIRETLDADSTDATVFYQWAYGEFDDRPSTGSSTAQQWSAQAALPYWVQLVRSGNTFTSYSSPDGMNWTQMGTSQTITMAQNAYIGLVLSGSTISNLNAATFDNVSVSSAATSAPVISTISATTGSVGSQLLISGSGFGATQGNSTVLLNGTPMTVNSWSSTSIIITIASGASSGLLIVSTAPTMNDSNAVDFTVTNQPLPTPWLDQDVGVTGAMGSASFTSGIFTVNGAGSGVAGSADGFHFVYQPLSGDGSIVARVTSVQYNAAAGVVIRETLSPGASEAATVLSNYNYIGSFVRTSKGGTVTEPADINNGLPYWLELVRDGNSFTSYGSPDGVNWTQIGSTQTISMAQNVYIGLMVASQTPGTLYTATFDNVSATIGTTPFVSGILPIIGGIDSPVTITGSNFGASQGSSTVSFNGLIATSVTSWSDSQIVASVPTGATTGPVAVAVNSIQSVANPTFTVVNPIIVSVSPPAAPPFGIITITGSGFGLDDDPVSFNGTVVYPVSWGNTSITVQVPSNATSGPLAVIEGTVPSNSVQFTVTEGLTVTAMSPTSGQVGTTVTITGTGFGSVQSDSAVTFNDTTASIVSWSDTSIVAIVPAGASTGPVTVEVASITVDGPVFQITSSVQLSDSFGHQTTYSSVISGGKWYVSSAQGSGCSSCTLRGNIQYQYDANGNLLSTTDELGHTTSYSYDSNNDVTSVAQPSVSGGAPNTTYTYNSFGEVLTQTNPLGNVTTNTYDSRGNLTSVTSPSPGNGGAASVTQFAYNGLGELTQITDPLGHITTVSYNPMGLIASITDPQSNVTSYGYDNRGNRTSVTDPMSHQTSFGYDAGNRLLNITYPGGSTTSFTYDYRGRRTSVTDQNGKTTSYAYDDADRLTSVTDPAGNVTQYSYDAENNLLSITDANNHATSFSYDAFGRLTQTTFPSNYFENYTYDAANNLTSKTDRKSQTINYVYDALNRLVGKNYPDSTSVEYTYDLVGKILQVNDPTGTYGLAYDGMGRLIGTTTQYSFLPNNFTNSIYI